MKLWLTALVALAACSLVASNTFEVDASIDPDAAGVLMLCGKEILLKRQGHILAVAQSSACEGDGVIRVRFKDGRTTNCVIGYVTVGVGQEFRYRLSDGGCVGVN